MHGLLRRISKIVASRFTSFPPSPSTSRPPKGFSHHDVGQRHVGPGRSLGKSGRKERVRKRVRVRAEKSPRLDIFFPSALRRIMSSLASRPPLRVSSCTLFESTVDTVDATSRGESGQEKGRKRRNITHGIRSERRGASKRFGLSFFFVQSPRSLRFALLSLSPSSLSSSSLP